MKYIKYLTAFSVVGIFVTSALPASAIAAFNSNNDIIRVTSPTNTNNPSTDISGGLGDSNDPILTDDAFLDELTFEGGINNGGSSFTSGNNFRAVQRVEVLSGREGGSSSGDAANVNAEFGAEDGNNDTPFHRAGFVETGDPVPEDIRESTDSDIQDPALLEALNNRNLTEIADGEGVDDDQGNDKPYTLQLVFQQGITDNHDGNDNAPEIVLFERGMNDPDIEIELITGGTFDNPTFVESAPGTPDLFSEASSNYFDTGLNILTDEINQGQSDDDQPLGVIGLDLSKDFTSYNGETVFGLRITSDSGGADINSALLASEDPGRFVDLPSDSDLVAPVPFETEGSMGLLALGGYVFYRYCKNRQKAFSQKS